MSDLWRIFNERLASAGYTLEDLSGNDSLFQIVAEEICGFTPQKVSDLLRECKMYEKQRKGGNNPIPSSSSFSNVDGNNGVLLNIPPRTVQPGLSIETSITSQPGILNTYPTSVVLSRANTFLRNLSGNDILISPVEVTEVPRSRKLIQSFRERLASMHKPVGSIELLWKLCSPKMLDNFKNGYQIKNSDDDDDKDLLCSSGIVLYRDNGTAAKFLQESPIHLIRQGWCLVAFDTAVGKSRRLEEEEIRLLKHFPMEECFNSLNNDGYDSIRVVPCNAFVVFHPDQLVPRFVVSIQSSDDARQLNYSNIVNSVDSSREQNSFKKAEKDEKSEKYFLSSSSPSPLPRVMKEQLQVLNNSKDKISESFNNITFSCHKHQGKEVEFWSPKEKRLLCSHCLFYEGYSKDNCVLVVEAIKNEAQKLEQWVQNALTFTNEIGTVGELFHSAEKDIDRNEEERREEIREQFKRMHTKLNSLEGDLLSQVENKSGRQREMLQNCFNNVQSIVHEIKRLTDDAKGPLSKYNAGIIDYKTAVALLRVTQSAFGEWRSVPIPMYTVVNGWDRDIFGEVEAILEPITLIENDGQVELPEAVDVNYLKN